MSWKRYPDLTWYVVLTHKAVMNTRSRSTAGYPHRTFVVFYRPSYVIETTVCLVYRPNAVSNNDHAVSDKHIKPAPH